MKIGELGIGTEISIEIKAGQKNFTFCQTVEQIMKGVVITSPLIYEGRMLNLNSGDVSITVYAQGDEEVPLQFRGCTAKLLQGKGRKLCAIACNNEGKRVNRRSNFRIFIGVSGTVSLSDGSGIKVDVTVRDISLMGVGFVVDKSKWEKEVSHVGIEFRGINEGNMRIQATVVHVTEVENNMLIVGCRILNCANDLSTYITHKQRENLRKISGKS